MMLHRLLTLVLPAALAAPLFASPTGGVPPQPQARAQAQSSEDIGRLFFTPNERDELDRIRIGINDSTGENLRTVRLDGVVQRNGAAPQFWVNGRPYKGLDVAGASIYNTPINASTIVVGLPPPDAHFVSLSVGQTLDPAGGNLREVYQRPPQELNLLLQVLGKRGEATKPKEKSKPPQADTTLRPPR